MPHSYYTQAQEDALDRQFRREAIHAHRKECEEAFGPPTGDQQEDDRRKWRILITAAEEVQVAEGQILAAVAQWIEEKGDTWPPTPNPCQLWWEKKVRLRKLIELSGTGEIATLARLLILKRLLKRSK